MPSICPEATRFGMPPSARRNAANLSDEEPALRVRIAESKMRHSAALGDRRLIAECTAFPAPIFVSLRQRAGEEPNSIIIASARRHDWRFVPKRQSAASARATNAGTPLAH